VVDGKVPSRHRFKDAAVAAGREIATRLSVEHLVALKNVEAAHDRMK
jgi:hypothetical protein